MAIDVLLQSELYKKKKKRKTKIYISTRTFFLCISFSHLRSETQSATIHDALKRFRAAVRQHMPLQPAARARLTTVYLAAAPFASERTALTVYVLRLQMIQQFAAGIVALCAAVPVADTDQTTVALAHAGATRC